MDCHRNKREAVSKASNEWVILLDSDNVIDVNYLDKIYNLKDTFESTPWLPFQILQPSFAKPSFNFSEYQGMMITKENISKHIEYATFGTMLNAMNFFINRDEYLKVWDGSVDPVTSDSIYFNYKWLEAGNSIYVVPGLEYEHRVHGHGKEEGSHYVKNVRRTKPGFHQSIINKLKAMK